MHAYLTKKIVIPGQHKLQCVEWRHEEGWMAVGGDNGLLKIIKVNDSSSSMDARGRVNHIGNQTLLGHNGRVLHLAWNNMYRKLASADENGAIIVWTLEPNTNKFEEEMINMSDHGPVGDVKWSHDGGKVCIVYGDGQIVVGTVDGKRLWAKSMGISLQHLVWSPDGSNIVIVNTDGIISVFDMLGNGVKELDHDGASDIVDLCWHDCGSSDRRNFVVAHASGDLYFRHDLNHQGTSRIDSGIAIEACRWNKDGKILAVCGVLNEMDPIEPYEDTSVVNFYNHDGTYLHSVKVPTSECLYDIVWDVSGKLLIAFENCVFFANTHTPASWTSVGNTMIYVSSDSSGGEYLMFFDPVRDRQSKHQVGEVLALRSNKYMCLTLISNQRPRHSKDVDGKIVVFDDVGTVLASKPSLLKPIHVVMSEACIAIADDRFVHVWNIDSYIRSLKKLEKNMHSLQNRGLERVLDCEIDSDFPVFAIDKFSPENKTAGRTSILTIEVSNKILFIGKDDDSIDLFSVDTLCRTKRVKVSVTPTCIAVNRDSTSIICMDSSKSLKVFDVLFDDDAKAVDLNLIFEEDSDPMWMVKWASDDNNTCALMENNRISIYDRSMGKRYQVGEIMDSGYLSKFSNQEIEVTLLQLDEYNMNNPVISKQTFETRLLKEIKAAINKGNIDDLCSFIPSDQNRVILNMIAEAALQNLDIKASKKLFIELKDYNGLLFLETLSKIQNESERRDQVDQFIAERSKDVSIPRDDKNLEEKVVGFIHSGKLYDAASCFFDMQEPHIILDKVNTRVDKTGMKKIGALFVSLGLQKLAIQCYDKIDSGLAADIAVELDRWGDAILLSNTDKREEIKAKARVRCDQLSADGDLIRAGIVYNQTGLHKEAASMWSKFGGEHLGKNRLDLKRAKMLFCLAGHEIANQRKKSVRLPKSKAIMSTTAETFQILVEENDLSKISKTNNRDAEDIWHKAAAYHFLMLAHEQLYHKQFESAMKTAIQCIDFADVIDKEVVFSIIALSAYKSKNFGSCSKALIMLKSIIKDESTLSGLQKLCFRIFRDQRPVDEDDLHEAYQYNRLEQGKKYHACTISGRYIINEHSVQCKICLHFMITSEINDRTSCSLCHASCSTAINAASPFSYK